MTTLLVFGVSGVGKSWLCRQAVSDLDMRHISGSELIRTEKKRLTSQIVSADALRLDRVVDNQQLLLDGFRIYKSRDGRPILFDGHNVVDTDEGLVKIPSEVIFGLEPTAFVVVTDKPENVIARRAADASRARPVRSAEAMSAYQELCVALACEHAGALSVPFREIRSGQTDNFIAFVEQSLKRTSPTQTQA
ncbi:adenylate kinase [Sinorhizobium meliloti]|uniref:ATP-binding protein n=1 Tax=Rhizobium meliloti TaxID=382 RepID=UPI000FDB64C5|nr:AAA family ATPase [Sinorhizobium meliloti]RVI66078.1 adenylate kinase [Sinorhizobium meliloti]